MYFYSPKENLFYPNELKDIYIEAGSFPSDVIEVDDSVYFEFTKYDLSDNKVRVSGKDGLPTWEEEKISKRQLIEDTKEKISFLLKEVKNVTQIWQTQLTLGIITDSDKSKLTDWMIYAQKLQQIDLKNINDISWPSKPSK